MAIEPSPPAWPRAGPDRQLETSAAEPPEIAAVRRATAAHLQRCGCSNVDDAVLVLSELVTNAVLYGGGALRIRVACDRGGIYISVQDSRTEAARLRTDNPAVGGRGLRIVDQLAERWGSTALAAGKDVWAVLPCTSSTDAAGP